MRRIQSHHLFLLFILIPPLIITSMCGMIFAFRSISFFTSPSFPDYLWSLRITRELSNKGYPVHDVSVSGSEPPGFGIIDVQIGNQVYSEQQRTYELVKTVHETVIKTFTSSSFQPGTVDVIVITVFDYSSGTYVVGIDFETARKYQLGEVSEETYYEHWSFPERTPEITPP